MNSRIERTLRVIPEGESAPRQVEFWRTRPYEERLSETMHLHRDGNELFKGGNPAYVFTITVRHVVDPR